eukprot:SAG11_NODE_17757_length_509_cov_3.197561_1_plen_65_part_00
MPAITKLGRSRLSGFVFHQLSTASQVNLLDMDIDLADVMPTEKVVAHLERMGDSSVSKKPKAKL